MTAPLPLVPLVSRLFVRALLSTNTPEVKSDHNPVSGPEEPVLTQNATNKITRGFFLETIWVFFFFFLSESPVCESELFRNKGPQTFVQILQSAHVKRIPFRPSGMYTGEKVSETAANASIDGP